MIVAGFEFSESPGTLLPQRLTSLEHQSNQIRRLDQRNNQASSIIKTLFMSVRFGILFLSYLAGFRAAVPRVMASKKRSKRWAHHEAPDSPLGVLLERECGEHRCAQYLVANRQTMTHESLAGCFGNESGSTAKPWF